MWTSPQCEAAGPGKCLLLGLDYTVATPVFTPGPRGHGSLRLAGDHTWLITGKQSRNGPLCVYKKTRVAFKSTTPHQRLKFFAVMCGISGSEWVFTRAPPAPSHLT